MSKIAKATLGLMIATVLSKVLGFGRELVLGSTYGLSHYSDAYIVAMEIPGIIFAAIATAISTTYIPLFYEVKENKNEESAMLFTNNIVNLVIIIALIMIGIVMIFTKPIVSLFAMGFEGEVLNLTISFTRILIWSILFIGIGYVTTSYLQIKGNFIIPGLIGLPYNIIIIISIILSSKTNIYILVVGTLIAYGSQLLFQLPETYKKGYKYQKYVNLNDEYVRKMIRIVTPIFIGVGVNQINALVDKSLASTLAEGSIAALNFANKLNWFVITLFIASIIAVIYPKISQLAVNGEKEDFISTVIMSINTVILMVVPISAGAIILSKPIVRILFERGNFDEKATKMTAIALIFYSLGMLAFGLRDVLSRVFYALKDTKTPMINGAISMILNIILNIILIKYMGHAGIALATSLSATITIILLMASLNKKVGGFNVNKIGNTFVKSFIAAIIMTIFTSLTYNGVYPIMGKDIIGQSISLGVSVLVGVIVYAGVIVLLKVDEVKFVIDRLKFILRKKI